MANTIMATYSPLPVTFERGEGAYLWDANNKQYLDAISGIAVCSLGHARPEVAQAIADQAAKLVHTSNLYQIDLQQKLADKLCGLSGLDEVFFSNSGTEANEAAIKLARLYASKKNISNPEIVVMESSFHGRTLAALSATGNTKIQQGFEPLVSGFIRVPYNDFDAIEALVESNPNIVAVLVEPVQGEGGVNIPAESYLTKISQLCDQQDWLFMLDEIQTGMCRTGKWFAFQHQNIKPDVMTLAKALGNGVPIGACMASGRAKGVFTAGTHGSTFGGNPLACRAALAVIDVMQTMQLDKVASSLGTYLVDGFTEQLSIEGITSIRGKGLMIGIELEKDCAELVGLALQQGVLINVTANKVVRLLPPLILTTEQADELINTVSSLIKQFIST
ncbi:MAG TPA: aspartate aminotransferase family protein [Thiothrix sp.]|nr:aspartate aminotransferase family protein [Thiothrix sp.]